MKYQTNDELDDLDFDEKNPVDMDADDWAEFYGRIDDFDDYLDHDHSMDY